jgi:hypothetical protein
MTSIPGAVRRCTSVLWTGKVPEKTPRGAFPPVGVKYGKHLKKKKKQLEFTFYTTRRKNKSLKNRVLFPSSFSFHSFIQSINSLQEIRLKLGFKLRLPDLLIKPIQRLTKYHMLLEAILKYSQRAGLKDEADSIAKAFHVMTVVPNQANDMMDIGRLQGFEVGENVQYTRRSKSP